MPSRHALRLLCCSNICKSIQKLTDSDVETATFNGSTDITCKSRAISDTCTCRFSTEYKTSTCRSAFPSPSSVPLYSIHNMMNAFILSGFDLHRVCEYPFHHG